MRHNVNATIPQMLIIWMNGFAKTFMVLHIAGVNDPEESLQPNPRIDLNYGMKGKNNLAFLGLRLSLDIQI